AGRSCYGSEKAGAHGRLALSGSGAALWRPRTADCPHSLRCGRRLCAIAVDGRCRSGAPPGPAPPGTNWRTLSCLGTTLSSRRLSPPAVAQPAVPLALFCRSAARSHRPALRLMRRHLVLFVRAPELGHGKRRLAREIGDVATVRFERLMLALLLRRLAADRRWRLRIAVTPDTACRHARHWRRRANVTRHGGGELGIRKGRAPRPWPPGPAGPGCR